MLLQRPVLAITLSVIVAVVVVAAYGTSVRDALAANWLYVEMLKASPVPDLLEHELRCAEEESGALATREPGDSFSDPCYRLSQARLSCLVGGLAQARTLLEGEAAQCERLDVLRAVTGDVAYGLGLWEEAMTAWSSPSSVALLLDRTRLLGDTVDEEKRLALLTALTNYEETMSANQASKIYELLGTYAQEIGDTELTREAYAAAVSYAPERHDFYVYLGVAQRDLGDLPGALQSHTRAVQLVDPTRCQAATWAYGQLGLTYEAMNDMPAAQDMFRNALKLAADNPGCPASRVNWLETHLQRLTNADTR